MEDKGKRKHGEDGSERGEEESEAILAYIAGEMPDEERTGFESRMTHDDEFAGEVAAIRATIEAGADWFAQAPPGLERADGIELPEPVRENERLTAGDTGRTGFGRTPAWIVAVVPSKRIWRGMAAAAIFAVGFVMGGWFQGPAGEPGGPMGKRFESLKTQNMRSQAETVPVSQESRREQQKEQQPEKRSEEIGDEDRDLRKIDRQVADLGGYRRAVERDGRIILEGRLKSSGGSALWIVDAGLDLSSLRQPSEGGAP